MSLSWRPATINSAADGDAAAVADLVSGRTWSHFCESLQRTGSKILRAELPDTQLDRATAFRHVLAMLQVGINQALASSHPLAPSLHPWRTDVYKYGHDCPDALYRSAPIRGGVTYCVRGNIGTVRYLSFQLEGPNGTVGNLRKDQMLLESDGSFEIFFSPERRAGNWLQTTPDTDQLFIRQFFSNWDQETAATFTVEAVTDTDGCTELNLHPGRPERVAAQFNALAKWFDDMTEYYLEREATDRAKWRNGFMPARAKVEAGGANEIILGHGHFDLDPDSALIIEVTPAPALYWSLDLANPWRESLDYAVRQTSLNDSQALLDEDGVFRAVVAHQDPGVPNWLDTMGHQSGALIFRWVLSEHAPDPRCTVVPHGEIRSHLPRTTPMISSQQRRDQTARRLAHVRRRFSS